MPERVTLVGQAPGRNGGEPLAGAIGRRLASLCALTYEEYLEAFGRVNVLDRWPGRSGSGDSFPMREAREAGRLLLDVHRGPLVALGTAVADCLGFPRHHLCRWLQAEGRAVAVVPHPSGRNRWWNDPANREAAGVFLRSCVR